MDLLCDSDVRPEPRLPRRSVRRYRPVHECARRSPQPRAVEAVSAGRDDRADARARPGGAGRAAPHRALGLHGRAG